NGSWEVDLKGSLGSPATYGVCLTTVIARRVLERADSKQYVNAIARADKWLQDFRPVSVLDATAVLLSLGNVGKDRQGDQYDRCIAIIRKGEDREGGWGPYVTSASEPFDTALVLLALRPFRQEAGVQEMLARGRKYLLRTQQEDGSWQATTRPAGAESYAQHISTTAWACQAILATKSVE